MSDKQKSFAKVIAALVALLGGMGGADAAGYTPDVQAVADLGLLGAAALIAYLHYVWFPIVREMRGDLKTALRLPVEEDAPESAPLQRTGPTHVVKSEAT